MLRGDDSFYSTHTQDRSVFFVSEIKIILLLTLVVIEVVDADALEQAVAHGGLPRARGSGHEVRQPFPYQPDVPGLVHQRLVRDGDLPHVERYIRQDR